MQIFVESPDLQLPSKALMVNPNLTFHNLKLNFLPTTIPSQTLDSLYFSFHGKPLRDTSTLSSLQVKPFSNLVLRIRVSGGGGDGGSTCAESRDCYLNMYAVKKPDKADPNETRLSRWTTCSLSSEPLKPPCVIDRIGNLFNKEPLVEALLGKKLPKEFGHIRGLKDMIPIQLSFKSKNSRDEINSETKFQCPISGVEFNGKYKFFALKTCGHILSAKALKEVKSSTCLVCHKEFSELDKIVINGSVEEVEELKERMEMEKAKLREKKEKKKVKNGLDVNNIGIEIESSTRLSGMKHGISEKDVDVNLGKKEVNGKITTNVGSSAKETTKSSGSSKKRFKASDTAPANATKEVYASIFTSSKKSDFKETYMCRSLPLGRN